MASRATAYRKARTSSTTKSPQLCEPRVRKLTLPLGHPSLELLDPRPDIQAIFCKYDRMFFGGKLYSEVSVNWSRRLKASAGTCMYDPDKATTKINLSEPILTLRPRKDLVETLLHEMIHAYIFITEEEDEGLEHGPVFHKIMNRINKEAGTEITIDHDFHDEVVFNQHQWQCNGKCQRLVQRCFNKPPGTADSWWKSHREVCGGKFIKIAEPGGVKLPAAFGLNIPTIKKQNLNVPLAKKTLDSKISGSKPLEKEKCKEQGNRSNVKKAFKKESTETKKAVQRDTSKKTKSTESANSAQRKAKGVSFPTKRTSNVMNKPRKCGKRGQASLTT